MIVEQRKARERARSELVAAVALLGAVSDRRVLGRIGPWGQANTPWIKGGLAIAVVAMSFGLLYTCRRIGAGSAAVHLIRAIDRRGGFSVRRGEELYAKGAPRLAGPLHRRIVEDARNLLGSRPSVVVDLGSGPGTLTAALGESLPAATVIGVEPNPRMLKIAAGAPSPGNVSFRAGAAEAIPVDDGSVTLLVSALSAHHWTDLKAAIAEIRRVLAPGGVARIHDVRFATYTDEELRAAADALRLPRATVTRSVPTGQGLVAVCALIEIRD